MEIVKQVNKLKEKRSVLGPKRIGFVPTMGALHEGHLSLIDHAKLKSDYVVVSIFVNPTQFNDPNDLAKYPRNIEQDLKLLEEKKVDLVFCPEYDSLYKSEVKAEVHLKGLDKELEGESREGHFDGVVRVLNLFFRLIKPQFTFFGEKDYQQLLVVQQLAHQHFKSINIIPCPTIRELNGLAMSSRNKRLSKKERDTASGIYKTLKHCQNRFDFDKIQHLESSYSNLLAEFSDLEYFEIRDAETLSKKGTNQTKWRAFVATKIAGVRLIDNIALNY